VHTIPAFTLGGGRENGRGCLLKREWGPSWGRENLDLKRSSPDGGEDWILD